MKQVVLSVVFIASCFVLPLNAIKIGEACTTTPDNCATDVPNGLCDTATLVCGCITSHVPNMALDQCLPKATAWEDPCTEDLQCSSVYEGSVCGTEGKCACEADHHFVDPKCWPTKDLGEPCTDKNECVLGGNQELATCATTCGCAADYKPSQDNKYCISSGLEGVCTTDPDTCTPSVANSVCTVDKCACTAAYVANTAKTACLKKATVWEDSCTEDQQCSSVYEGSVCAGRKCACKADHHFVDPKCWSTKDLGETCTDVKECLLGGNQELATCATTCGCVTDYKPSQDNKNCISTGLDGKCTLDPDTCTPSVADSECTNDKCACKAAFIANNAKTACLKKAVNWEDPCTEVQQCSSVFVDSTCTAQKCACKVDYHFVEDKCWQSKDLTEACTDSRECYLPGEAADRIECKNEECACKNGFVPTDDGTSCKNSGIRAMISIFSLIPALLLSFRKYF